MRLDCSARLFRAALAPLLPLLASCGPTYQFTPPATPMGQACIIQCQSSSDQCRTQENEKVRQCEWRKQMAQAELDRCRASTNDPMSCNTQVPLCYMANYNPCDIRYRQCYQACGGTVTEVETK